MSTASGAIRTHALRTRLIRAGLITLALAYVGALLIAPLVGIVWTALGSGFDVVKETFARADVKHALWLTFIITVTTVVLVTVFGVLTAWVLTRDEFPGKRLLNGLVELPLAVSPVTVGLMAVLLFGTGGWFSEFFAARGIQVIFALPSMILVTIFICIPFVIREVGPILEEVGTNEEEAALTLGASHPAMFFRVTLPNIRWGLLYGMALSTARALGEIGAVLIVSGQIQGHTETATLYIFRAFEERQEASGTVVAIALALVSILLLIGIETFKHHRSKEARS